MASALGASEAIHGLPFHPHLSEMVSAVSLPFKQKGGCSAVLHLSEAQPCSVFEIEAGRFQPGPQESSTIAERRMQASRLP